MEKMLKSLPKNYRNEKHKEFFLLPDEFRAGYWYGERTQEGIKRGIACFPTLQKAFQDAVDWIKRTTTSNFAVAHFYEAVRKEVLKQHYGDDYSKCHTCHWWRKAACRNRAGKNDIETANIFASATADGICKHYYPGTPTVWE